MKIFLANDNEELIAQNLDFEALESRAKVLFDQDLAFKVFYTVQNIDNDFTRNIPIDSIDPKPKCECSTLDDWCFGPGDWECSSSDCEVKTRGCGFFLIRKCDGDCQL